MSDAAVEMYRRAKAAGFSDAAARAAAQDFAATVAARQIADITDAEMDVPALFDLDANEETP